MLAIVSCSKEPNKTMDQNEKSFFIEKNIQSENFQKTNPRIEEVLQLQGEEQRLAYKMLSKEGKYQLWLDKFNHILENFNLSEQKNNHIVELRNIIEPDFFDRNSKRSIEIYQSFIPNWLMEATDIFFSRGNEPLF